MSSVKSTNKTSGVKASSSRSNSGRGNASEKSATSRSGGSRTSKSAATKTSGRNSKVGGSNAKGGRGGSKTGTKQGNAGYLSVWEDPVLREILLVLIAAAAIFLSLCNFGLIGVAGKAISSVLFGIFGFFQYILPLLIAILFFFQASNYGNQNATIKIVACGVLFFNLGIFAELIGGYSKTSTYYNLKELYQYSSLKRGGGVISGSICYFLSHYLSKVGCIFLSLTIFVICVVLISEKSLIHMIKNGSKIAYQKTKQSVDSSRQHSYERRQNAYERRMQEMEEQELEEQERILRMDRKVDGVSIQTLKEEMQDASLERIRDDIHEIMLHEEEPKKVKRKKAVKVTQEEEVISEPQMEEGIIEAEDITETEESDPEVSFENLPTFERGLEKGVDVPVYDEMSTDIQNHDFVKPEYMPEHEVEAPFDFDAITIEGLAYDDDNDDELNDKSDFPSYGDHSYTHADSPYRVSEKELDPSYEYAYQMQTEVSSRANLEAGWNVVKESNYENAMKETSDGSISYQKEWKKETFEATEFKKNERKSGQTPSNHEFKIEKSENTQEVLEIPKKVEVREYIFPSVDLLNPVDNSKRGDSQSKLKETARRLQQTLQNFGVNVTITNISQGPTVTRYELQPEQGVKVSKIVSLTDDIKLNLAATDIRMEAPIPGKAAIGIEVPNAEAVSVAFRDLVESPEFKNFSSNICFAVGKDIGGKVIISDIAKMPHLLIAGATGSGKSVCINTIIMSILYKAKPDDVKMIMIDPKVVELSVYNGIPHLLIPVVTEAKKAAGALQWGVSEMTDRYQKFADMGVRDIKGYNAKVKEMAERGDENAPAKMPQLVIIVDELADLMMVAQGEVEEAICRLAQLARAAGIHLIIATQRPSVDVITGLIKANMPSRVAFAVSSGTDSRTILDQVGAEKLLGKGDMLFYPQGYSKPARIQGAFVSDDEVANVVDFLKNQAIGNVYDADIQEKIQSIKASSGSSGGSGSDSPNGYDELFEMAARRIFEKEKASIGDLQRALKIGFNRAARIMDQLCEAGIVGEEEGTKPRKIIMTEEEFEQFVEDYL